MPRKIECWTDHIIGEPQDLAKSLVGYSEREIVIITCSIIDSLLADLITSKLRNDEKEVESFLGLNSDGRAPLGSFGSRIQAAYLLEMISADDFRICQIVKGIRNLFAHRAIVSFANEGIVSKIRQITEIIRDRGPSEVKPDRKYSTKEELTQALAELNYSKDACVGYYIGTASMLIKKLHEACATKATR